MNLKRRHLLIMTSLILIVSSLRAQPEFTQHLVRQNYMDAYIVKIGDVDNDGDFDLVYCGWEGNRIGWSENDGEFDFDNYDVDARFSYPGGMQICDMDDDGDLDIVAGSQSLDAVYWWDYDEGDWTRHNVGGGLDGCREIYVADMDGDVDLDVVGVALWSGDVVWYENDGENDFDSHQVDDDLTSANGVHIVDLDSDGDKDIIAAAQSDDVVIWYENDGNEDWEEHQIADDDDGGADWINSGDVDQDGDIDLFGTTHGNGAIRWWENDGAEDFTLHTLTEDAEFPMLIELADLDLDGDMDFITTESTANKLAMWENDGDQTFTEQVISDEYSSCRGLDLFDMDNDGDLDIATTGWRRNRIDWWENNLDPERNASAFGTVTDFETREPIEDAIVQIGIGRDTTDANGNYSIQQLLNGENIAAISHNDYATYRETVELMEGENEFDFQLSPSSPVSGTVSDIDTGDPIEGALITFGDDNATSDEDGEWSVNPQDQGEFRVTIAAEHYYVFSEVVEVEHGENVFEFELTPLATISGTIADSETHTAIEGAEISFGDTLYSAASDVDGNYYIIDVKAGIYTLSIVAEGYFDYELEEFEVEERENILDFEIDILSGDLTGVITDELTGDELTGVTITVIDPVTMEIYRQVQTDENGGYLAPALHDLVRYRVIASIENYAPSDTEEVMIRWNRDNEQDFELSPIFTRTIEQLQTEQDLQTWVSATGIVTQGSNTTVTQHTDIYIQDNSGWGIQVYASEPTDPENNIERGDEVNVTGFLAEVNDITRITNFEIEVISTGNDLPDPLVESTNEMSRLNQREGTWAQITGQISRTPPDEGDYYLAVDDGSGSCDVRIIGITGIDLTEMAADDWGRFTGIISLSRQGLRIIPNMPEDARRLNINPPTNLYTETEEIPGDTLCLHVYMSWDHNQGGGLPDDDIDEWQNFKIYRDGEYVGVTEERAWSEVIYDPNPGEYESYSWIYTVTAVYDECESESSNEVEVTWDITTVVERPWSDIPTKWALEAVYPNPFNPLLSVVVAIPKHSVLTIQLVNILGEEVASLADGAFPAGYHQFTLDAADKTSGVYFINAIVPGKMKEVMKVVLIK
ncbi:carboxypeptidase regulatory-like domain-containing protein [Calditrichota bacterium]